MTAGIQLVNLAATQRGKPYRFGFEVNSDYNHPDRYYQARAWDCSELTSVTCAVFGVALPDGAFNQWRATERISVAQASRTPGALVFAGDGTGSGRSSIWHVAFSRGDGWTEEARSRTMGVGSWPIGTRFRYGGLIRGVDYGAPPPSATLPIRPTVRLGQHDRACAILNYELAVVTGKAGSGDLYDWATVQSLQDLARVLSRDWGNCIQTTEKMWAALDMLALAKGQLVRV